MKHPMMYYVYYLAGCLFVGAMAVVVFHMIQLWITASSM